MNEIHPSAIVERGARLGHGVKIGPMCLVGSDVELGDGTDLVSHVTVVGRTRIGAGTRIFPFASVGHPPQDLKYKGEASELWEQVQHAMGEYPDSTCAVLRGFAKAFPEKREQFEIFEKSCKLYLEQQRRDLTGRLRMDQLDFLIAQKEFAKAAEVAVKALGECAGESSVTPELARRCVDSLRNLKQLDRAVEPVKTAASRLPIFRAYQINTNWIETMELLRDLHKELGQLDFAAEVQWRMDSNVKNLMGRFK